MSDSKPLINPSDPNNPLRQLHTKARGSNPHYPQRAPVPDDKVDWKVEWPDYQPPDFTTDGIVKKAKSKDSSVDFFDAKDMARIFQTDSSSADARHTFENGGRFLLDPVSSRPLNPQGRTGICGRGKLYRWGANHAADAVVLQHSKPHPRIVAIQRHDNGQWALPGGMIDRDEEAVAAAVREFREEAANVDKKWNEEEAAKQKKLVDDVVSSARARLAYCGYVDDPRNTDNAWMETSAFLFECSEDDAKELKLVSGDDASAVKWIEATDSNPDYQNLYASHKPMVDAIIAALSRDKKV